MGERPADNKHDEQRRANMKCGLFPQRIGLPHSVRKKQASLQNFHQHNHEAGRHPSSADQQKRPAQARGRRGTPRTDLQAGGQGFQSPSSTWSEARFERGVGALGRELAVDRREERRAAHRA